VTRQKNDAADAEAIVIAAQRPEMCLIIPKMEEQQAKALLSHGRERLVRTGMLSPVDYEKRGYSGRARQLSPKCLCQHFHKG
jgi:hypothetical protein